MTDNEILDSIYSDAVEGISLLVDTYADLVYKVVYQVLSDVGNQEDICDCVCDAFVAFFYNIDDVDLSRGSIKGFLGVIARRRAVNLRYTLNPDDERAFDEYTVEEMSENLEAEEVHENAELSDMIIRMCLKEIAPEATEEVEEAIEDFAEESDEEAESEEITEPPKKKRRRFGRVLKTLVVIVSIVSVIAAAVVAYEKLSVPKYVPPTTQTTIQPTTQAGSFNPLFSAITAGNQKLIEELITNSLLLTDDILRFALENADKISYDSIRRIAEEVRNKYGSTGLEPILEGAIFGDFQTVKDELKNKDESEMTPAEKLAKFFVTTFGSEAGQ